MAKIQSKDFDIVISTESDNNPEKILSPKIKSSALLAKVYQVLKNKEEQVEHQARYPAKSTLQNVIFQKII